MSDQQLIALAEWLYKEATYAASVDEGHWRDWGDPLSEEDAIRMFVAAVRDGTPLPERKAIRFHGRPISEEDR